MKVRFLASVLLVGLLLGCGGGGGPSIPSPFAGTFAGTMVSGSATGSATITVALSGAFAGTVFDDTFQIGGTTSGKIKNNGELNGTTTWSGFEPVTMTGTVSLSAGGSSLTGTILVDGEATTFDLTRQ